MQEKEEDHYDDGDESGGGALWDSDGSGLQQVPSQVGGIGSASSAKTVAKTVVGGGELLDGSGGGAERVLRTADTARQGGADARGQVVAGPPSVAVGLSWVVGAMVVETMQSHHHDHAFLFEGRLGAFEHGVPAWLQHHSVMMLLAGCGLAAMFAWRCWLALTHKAKGGRGAASAGL